MRPGAAAAQPGAAAVNQTGESREQTDPTVPAPSTRPSSAQAERKSSDRGEPAGQSRRESRSPTQPPSPNGGNDGGSHSPPEGSQRLRQPPQPTEQTQPETSRR